MGDVDVHALRSVDLDLFAGEFMVLLGASGSGKSRPRPGGPAPPALVRAGMIAAVVAMLGAWMRPTPLEVEAGVAFRGPLDHRQRGGHDARA